MPRAYRPMKTDDGKIRPTVGESATKLDVRAEDLSPDENGNAVPGKGGLSVVSSIAGLRSRVAKMLFSPTMVPRRLNKLVPGAIGSNSLHVFRIGDGAFEIGLLTEKLQLEPDVEHHGTIQPASVMPYDEYKQTIIETQDMWESGESDNDS